MAARIVANGNDPLNIDIDQLQAMRTSAGLGGLRLVSWVDVPRDHILWPAAIDFLKRHPDVVANCLGEPDEPEELQSERLRIEALCAVVGPTAARTIDANRRKLMGDFQ